MPLNLVDLIATLPQAWVTIQLFCYEFTVQAMITKIDDSVKFGSWLDEFHKKCFFICHIVKMQDPCVQVQSTAKLVKQLRDMICAILDHVPGYEATNRGQRSNGEIVSKFTNGCIYELILDTASCVWAQLEETQQELTAEWLRQKTWRIEKLLRRVLAMQRCAPKLNVNRSSLRQRHDRHLKVFMEMAAFQRASRLSSVATTSEALEDSVRHYKTNSAPHVEWLLRPYQQHGYPRCLKASRVCNSCTRINAPIRWTTCFFCSQDLHVGCAVSLISRQKLCHARCVLLVESQLKADTDLRDPPILAIALNV